MFLQAGLSNSSSPQVNFTDQDGSTAKIKAAVLFTALLLSAGFTAAQPQILQPVDQTQGDYQEMFGSSGETDGENLVFKAQVNDASNIFTGGLIQLYEKDATSKTWQLVDETETNTGHPDGQEYYFGQLGEDTIEEGSSSTFTVDGDEHTIEVVDVYEDETADILVDGESESVEPGDYFDFSGRPVLVSYITYTCLDTCVEEAHFKILDNDHQVSEGEKSFRVALANDDGTPQIYSEQIHLSVDTSDRTPYLNRTTSDGKRVRSFNRTTVGLFSGITGYVTEDQGDNYNISLYNDENDELVAYSTSDKGTTLIKAKGVFYDVINFFTDTAETGEHRFPTVGSELHSSTGFDDNYYFEIEDLADGTTRTTQVFQTTTDGENYAPDISNVEGYNGSSWKTITQYTDYGEPLDRIRVNVDDANNDFHAVDMYLESDYTGSIQLNDSIGAYTYDYNGEINRSGNWTLKVNVTDGDKHDYQTYNWTVSWGDLQANLTVNNQTGEVEVKKGQEANWTCTYTCLGGECRAEQLDNTSCYLDPAEINTTDSSSSSKSEDSRWSGIEAFLTWLLEGDLF